MSLVTTAVLWVCELFHSWCLVEKDLESLPGTVGKRSRGDSKLVGRCLAFAYMHENSEGIASKLLHFISEEKSRLMVLMSSQQFTGCALFSVGISAVTIVTTVTAPTT
jgi:hypothetical protein